MSQLVFLEVDCRWPELELEEALPALSELAQKRAQRYKAPLARRNLIATQSVLQEILRALDLISQMRLCEGGRPYLENSDLEFNLSHSEDRALFLFCRDPILERALGVDLEYLDRRVERDALAKRFFTDKEFEYCVGSKERFFELWTRKEAVLKTNGVGLRVSLDSFSVLQDEVSDHVTGQPLSLATRRLEGDYLASWALARGFSFTETLWLQHKDPQWLPQLLKALA